ncbi:MAG TPA: hypothetical protein VFF70_07140, partial [Anaerolineae bacterium]|nr:hypothetical protein [Anaerolineae bacterium]
FDWSQLQGSGPNDWNQFQVQDNWIDDAAQHGRQVVGLMENTPHWATDGTTGSGVPRGLYLPIDNPNNLWAGFVRALVKRTVGRVDHWIIWNEPDIEPPDSGIQFDGSVADYYQLVKVAYQVAKQENPSAIIHLAGLTYYHDTTYHRVAYLQRFVTEAKKDAGAAANHDYFDVASLHIYHNSDEIYNVASIMRNILRQNGLKQPLWINETNVQPSSDPFLPWPYPTWVVSLDQQADFLIHAFAMGLAAGADRIAVYKLIDIPAPQPGWPPDGLIRTDRSHRPAYDALKVITTYFRDTRSARLVRTGSTDIVTLNRGSQTTRVAWSRSSAATTISLPAFAQQATLVSVDGSTQPLSAINNRYRLTLPGAKCDDPKFGCAVGGSPIILVEDAPSKSGGLVIVSTVTPASPCTNCTPTVTSAHTATPCPDCTPTPTRTRQPTKTFTPTLTTSPQPTSTSTASPTFTFTPTPTGLPSPTSTPLPSIANADLPIGLFAVGILLALILIVFLRKR